jgi:CRP/FNR family transcriptional regulator
MNIETHQDKEFSLYSPVHAPVHHSRVENEWSSMSEVMGILRYDAPDAARQSSVMFRRRRLRAGQSLFVMGQEFSGLYLVRLGAMKSVVTHDDGNEHVISFSMKGDLLGTDGVCKNHYWCEAVALTDCEVIRLPADELFSPVRANDDMERMLYWAISREISKEQAGYAVSHAAKAEMRVARFLLAQSDRFAEIGCSAHRFKLSMTRRDIGNYLSLTLETVSRALSTLHNIGIVEVANREITIKSMDGLKTFEG